MRRVLYVLGGLLLAVIEIQAVIDVAEAEDKTPDVLLLVFTDES